MTVLWFLSTLTLAGVFAFAAIAKLADHRSSERTLVDFGVPPTLARPVRMLLPVAELMVVVFLVVPQWRSWGGLAALTMLVTFAVAILVNLAHGRAPDCHCFGQIRARPVGWATLGRNGVLATCAALVAWYQPGRDRPVIGLALMAHAWLLGAALGGLAMFVVSGQGWFLLHLLRQHGRLLVRVDRLENALTRTGIPLLTDIEPPAGLSVGTPAPSFELPSLAGGITTLQTLCSQGKPVLLIFSDPACQPCQALVPDIGRWARAYRGRLVLAIVSRGSVERHRATASAYGDVPILLQRDREIATQYLATSTPSAILVSQDGGIGSPLAVGADSTRSLVEDLMNHRSLQPSDGGAAAARAVGRPAATDDRPVATRVPSFRLSDLDGRVWESGDLTGTRAVLIFWNPGCRFCNDMLPALRRWEAERSQLTPQLILISRGSIDVNRQLQLRATVLLDDTFSVGASLGVSGTPSAIGIDPEGHPWSPIAVGADNVLALAASTGP